MSDRRDGCYRWVIRTPRHDDEPMIAWWRDGYWDLPGDECGMQRVHKVGVGGTLDAPPDVWEDDLPAMSASYGTDDPDAL